MALGFIGNLAGRILPGLRSTPAAAPEHSIPTPGTSPSSRGTGPAGMPPNLAGSARQATFMADAGRPRVSLATLQARTRAAVDENLPAGVEMQRGMAAAQTRTSMESFAIGAALQQSNSSLHQGENAVATAVKFQNKLSDDAKDAI